VLGVPGTVLAETLITYLVREIITRASRGGPLVPLAAQMNHDVTSLQVQQTHDAVRQISAAVQEALQRLDARAPAQLSSPPLADTDVALHVEQLLGGLELGEHDEAERRVNRLFLPLFRNQQRAAVEALIHVATTTRDHTTQLLACSLLEAADRLDPMLIKIDDVEGLARSTSFSLRSSAAVVLWQWDYVAADLLEVARIEPRAVPADLARKLALDQVRTVAIRATELLRVMEAVEEEDRGNYYGQFGM
jgi:hypothetical protein